eukprot:CAMPEP_0184694462 /NCGR_PEP_ID=MMETSP0313-20130426/2412_1 /TAXON_ID=2792 /ORGANISM="Porphyridium aerugineum, Strain SAG 1380-2" /LENGTH=433 /DNA_ID=CAMNT_0027152757 /DNA_START=396 /DNA_END=1697 /DNA_ORIENTATION=-
MSDTEWIVVSKPPRRRNQHVLASDAHDGTIHPPTKHGGRPSHLVESAPTGVSLSSSVSRPSMDSEAASPFRYKSISKHHHHQNSVSHSDGDAVWNSVLLLKRELETNAWVIHLLELLRVFIDQSCPYKTADLVCYGLGSFETSKNAKYQFAFALLLIETFPAYFSKQLLMYDPVMTSADHSLSVRAGFTVPGTNNGGLNPVMGSCSSNHVVCSPKEDTSMSSEAREPIVSEAPSGFDAEDDLAEEGSTLKRSSSSNLSRSSSTTSMSSLEDGSEPPSMKSLTDEAELVSSVPIATEAAHESNGTFYFMPHCGKGLYNNILFSNWDKEKLQNIFILGNSFAHYEARCLRAKDVSFVERCLDIVTELPCMDAKHCPYYTAFNDLSFHYFKAETLNAVSDEYWMWRPEKMRLDDPEVIIIPSGNKRSRRSNRRKIE